MLNCDPEVWWYMFFCRKQARANVYHAPGKGKPKSEAMVAYEVSSHPDIMDADDLSSYSPEEWSDMRTKKQLHVAKMAAKFAKKEGKDADTESVKKDTSSTRTGKAKRTRKPKFPPVKTDDDIKKQAAEDARQEAVRQTAFNSALKANLAEMSTPSDPQSKSDGPPAGGTN